MLFFFFQAENIINSLLKFFSLLFPMLFYSAFTLFILLYSSFHFYLTCFTKRVGLVLQVTRMRTSLWVAPTRYEFMYFVLLHEVNRSIDRSLAARIMSANRRVPPQPQPVTNAATVEQLPQDHLQMKYLTVDRNYETLKRLARKGELRCTVHVQLCC